MIYKKYVNIAWRGGLLTWFPVVSVFVIILYVLCTCQSLPEFRENWINVSSPLASTPLVIESIGALVERDALKLLLCVCLPAWLSIEQWVKATAVKLAALKSEYYTNELELHLNRNVTHNLARVISWSWGKNFSAVSIPLFSLFKLLKCLIEYGCWNHFSFYVKCTVRGLKWICFLCVNNAEAAHHPILCLI